MVTNRKYYILSSSLGEASSIANFLPVEYNFDVILVNASTRVDIELPQRITSLRYYDELIDEECGKTITKESQAFYNSWHIDPQTDKNITQLDGINYAQVLFPSIEILIVAFNRYFRGLSLLLEPQSTVFFSRDMHPNITLALRAASRGREIELTKVNVDKVSSKFFLYGRAKLKLIFEIGFRDLSPHFKNRQLKSVLAFWLSYFNNMYLKLGAPKKPSVLIFQTGKMDSFFYYSLKEKNSPLRVIFPFSLNPKAYLLNREFTYHFHSYTFIPCYKTRKLKAEILRNLKKLNSREEYRILFEDNLFPFLPGIKKYFKTAKQQLRILKPGIVLLTAEENESNLLLAQAAKALGIKTAVTAHGYNFWGYKDNKTGPDAVFNYCFSFGKKDFEDYSEQGVSKERIFITSHPYFSKFLPFKKIPADPPLKKALLLPLDFMITGPNFKIGDRFKFLNCAIDLLTQMKIEIIGLKVREESEYTHSGIHDFYEYNGVKVPLYSGYSNFIDIVNSADFVIGPLSTAFIEASLMGKPYFNFWPQNDLKAIPFVCNSSFKMIHIAKTMNELKENIEKKQILREGYTLDDILFHTTLEGKNSFEEFYVSSLLKCIQ